MPYGVLLQLRRYNVKRVTEILAENLSVSTRAGSFFWQKKGANKFGTEFAVEVMSIR